MPKGIGYGPKKKKKTKKKGKKKWLNSMPFLKLLLRPL